MPDISVIIPAYNRAGLIGETLRSLLNQTLPAKEIILVDDGSTDGTAEAVEREFSVFREQFSGNSKSNIPNPIFKILRQANTGPGAARNRGLAEATGEFIHFFDSDDIASPNKHEVQLKALLETGADVAYGPWVKGRFAPNQAQAVASGELSVASLDSVDTRYHLPAIIYSGFTPEGPVLQAQGLPQGDLVRALLTNWSVIPHACLFRRSILEEVGGFPEAIWVGEDQLLFLRCLLAGAKVVHTPETMVFYRLGNDPGKLTATGAAQKRHARDWARFLVKANEEVASGGERGESVRNHETHEMTRNEEACQRPGTCAGAAFSNSFTSELARDSENTSLTRAAIGPSSSAPSSDNLGMGSGEGNQLADSEGFLEGQSQAGLQMDNKKNYTIRSADDLLASRKQSDENPVNLVNPVKNCFGFHLRAYEAWRDLEKFFPYGEDELKNDLKRIWKKNSYSVFSIQFSGFLLRKLGGLKLRLLGYREHSSFRCRKNSVFIAERCGAANQK
jgi:glycosyltransferase involved in cell wall biosynthesis